MKKFKRHTDRLKEIDTRNKLPSKLKKIFCLDLSGNELTELKPELLQNLTNLVYLDLSRNRITKLRYFLNY